VRSWAFANLLILALAISGFISGSAAIAGQRADSLLPEQSAAKGRTILQQVIATLGGRAFLEVRDYDCMGRLAQIGHSGELMGYTEFRDMWVLPDKNRTEYIVKGQHNIAQFLIGMESLGFANGGVTMTVFNGNQGWMLDKGGVSEQPEDAIKTFTEQVKSGMNNLLRYRLNEPGVDVRYAGTDLLDLKEADWIEITDMDHRMLRIAVDQATHRPLRWVVTTQNRDTKERDEVSTMYMQFVGYDGVQTPSRISRSINGREVSQVTYSSCKYNSNLSVDLFTKTGLEHAKK
jgi:hypothetical protein